MAPSESDARHADVLTVGGPKGEEALPVFSFEDEALLYLHMEELGSGWRARVTMAGELFYMLLCPFSGIGWIALDPLPGLLGRLTLGLVSLRREDFVRTLTGGREARVTSPSRNLLPVPGPACSP